MTDAHGGAIPRYAERGASQHATADARLTFKLAVRHLAPLQTAAAPDRLKGLSSTIAQRFLPNFCILCVYSYSEEERIISGYWGQWQRWNIDRPANIVYSQHLGVRNCVAAPRSRA